MTRRAHGESSPWEPGTGRASLDARTETRTTTQTETHTEGDHMVSTGLEGMDVAAVEGLSGELSAAGEEIRSLGTSLTSQIEGLFWEGDDATAFRSDWGDELMPLLQQISTAVSELGTEAARQAAAQTATSSR